MSKVLYHITMSLDGFIAGPQDDMSWMAASAGSAASAGPNPVVDEILPQIGSLLIGHRTYYPANSAEGEPYGGLWTGPMFVYTNEDPSTAADGFTFVSGDISSAVAKAADAAGAGYVVILGAATARKCLEAGLLDEILVHVVPVLIGDGVRLFDHPGGTNVHLEPIKVTYTPPVTNMWWRVK